LKSSCNNGWSPIRKRRPPGECKKSWILVEQYGGLLMILWHNHVFNENDFPSFCSIYEELIALCKERGAWVAPAAKLSNGGIHDENGIMFPGRK